MTDPPAETPAPSLEPASGGYDPADTLQTTDQLAKPPAPGWGGSGGGSGSSEPVSPAALRPMFKTVWEQGHGLAATFSDIESVRLKESEAESLAGSTMVLVGPYLKKIENLPALLAVVSILLVELSIFGRAFQEDKRRHPERHNGKQRRQYQAPEDYVPPPQERPSAPPALDPTLLGLNGRSDGRPNGDVPGG
jgi:hypothetical protein